MRGPALRIARGKHSKGDENMNPTTMLARAACAVGLGLALAGCAAPFQPVTERNSPLTQGNVQMNVLVRPDHQGRRARDLRGAERDDARWRRQ